jgi:hypothetical protein
VLRRNHGFLKSAADGGSEEGLALAATWEQLCGAADEKPLEGGCTDAAALRIFERDAERTFMTTSHRASMIGSLKQFWPENKDYHQVLPRVCLCSHCATKRTIAPRIPPTPPRRGRARASRARI